MEVNGSVCEEGRVGSDRVVGFCFNLDAQERTVLGLVWDCGWLDINDINDRSNRDVGIPPTTGWLHAL